MEPKTYITRFGAMKERLRLAERTSGYIALNGDLMKIVSLEDVDDAVVADLLPARFMPLAA